MPFFFSGRFRLAPVARLLAALLLVSSVAIAQQPAKEDRPASTPYRGPLDIFDKPGREDRLQIDRVMDLLAITTGKSVADIGAGSGWFTVRAASRVGAKGDVYAVDINPEAVRTIRERAVREKLANIQAIEGKPEDPLLKPSSVDAVLLLKTYHEVQHPVDLMRKTRAALRPGARVGIIDRNGSAQDHGIQRDIVVREMSEAGYKLTGEHDFTKADGQDYFLIFEVKPN
jgi:SAM-dependent methyltransferase